MIVPTRNRQQNILELIETWKATDTENVDLCIAIEKDNTNAYSDFLLGPTTKGIIVSINSPMRMCPCVNIVANKFVNDYKYIGFMGDDHRFRTKDWGKLMIEKLGNLGIGYGDDLLMHENLPTACILTSNIIKELGFMILPETIHLYADNYWKDLGIGIQRLFYIPEIIIEHCHFSTGKSQFDPTYQATNNDAVNEHDKAIYEAWRTGAGHLETIQKILVTLNP